MEDSAEERKEGSDEQNTNHNKDRRRSKDDGKKGEGEQQEAEERNGHKSKRRSERAKREREERRSEGNEAGRQGNSEPPTKDPRRRPLKCASGETRAEAAPPVNKVTDSTCSRTLRPRPPRRRPPSVPPSPPPRPRAASITPKRVAPWVCAMGPTPRNLCGVEGCTRVGARASRYHPHFLTIQSILSGPRADGPYSPRAAITNYIAS